MEPILQSSEDGLQWLGDIPEPRTEFPSRGSVHWHDAPMGLELETVWQFEIEEDSRYTGEPHKDKYKVKNPKLATEVIDLRDYASEREIRIVLTYEGIYLPVDLLYNTCILWIKDNLCIGPLSLVQKDNTGSWILASSVTRDSIRCTKLSMQMVQSIKLDGTRYLLKPGEEGSHVGYVNWESDETLAGHVLNRLLKRDRKTAEALGVTKRVFRAYLEAIESANLIGPDDHRELAFNERIEDILKTIEKRDEFLEQVASVCFDFEGAKEKVAQRTDEEYKKKLSEYTARLNTDLEDKRLELGQLEEEVAKKEQESAAASVRLQAIKEKLEERVQNFDVVLEERLRELAQKPERLFAELAITNALVAKPSNLVPHHQFNASSSTPQVSADVPRTKDLRSLMSDLCGRLMARGISPVVGMNLHSLLLAGTVPVLIGASSFDVISAYADSVSGGKLHWIPVGGSLFEPSDLLARFDPVSRTLIPHSGGIIDLLLDESNSMHIVVLDGFNRASVDGYLIPLLKSVHDVARGSSSPRSIPLAPQRLMSPNDAYADVSRIAWRRNVLLVLLPSTGSSTLPVPAELWEWCSALGTDNPFPKSQPLPNEKKRVTASNWDTWVQGLKQKTETLPELGRSFPKVGHLPPAIIDTAERIVESVTLGGRNREDAMALCFQASLYPYLLSRQTQMDQIFQHLGVTQNTLDPQIADIVKQLGE